MRAAPSDRAGTRWPGKTPNGGRALDAVPAGNAQPETRTSVNAADSSSRLLQSSFL